MRKFLPHYFLCAPLALCLMAGTASADGMSNTDELTMSVVEQNNPAPLVQPAALPKGPGLVLAEKPYGGRSETSKPATPVIEKPAVVERPKCVPKRRR